ncbi:hypothetical protein MC885_007787 [Smutsia gigantea]|nr:hypothetical protein MC885_007787 [Smutsia gigantea]
MMSKIPERENTGSASPLNRLNDSPTLKKLDESPILKSEFIGHDSHDNIKELDSLSDMKNDQLRSYCPIELNINGSPGAESDLATVCTSKTDTCLMSSDDSVTGSEHACMLSSNGFQNINRCKEKDLDDASMRHNKSESPFRETEPVVSSHQSKLMSLPVKAVDYSKTIIQKQSVDMRVSWCKTKDSDTYCTSNDNNPLCHSEAENIEPLVTKISSNSFMTSLPPGVKVDSLNLLQCGERTSPVQDTIVKSKSTEFLKHAEKETVVEVGSGLPDSGRGFASWENRHKSGLSGKCVQEAQEEGSSILPDRRGRSELSLDEEEGRGHAHTSDDSEVVFSSCDLNLTMEDHDGVTYTLKCDSSGHASEVVSTVHEDYSGASESSGDESDPEDTDSDDSSVPRNRLQSVVVVPKNSTLPMEETTVKVIDTILTTGKMRDWSQGDISYEEKFESIASKACPQTEKFFFHKATEKNPEISFTQPSRKQIDNHLPEIAHPQSDGVDSTSYADVKSDLGHPNCEDTVKVIMVSRQQEELPVYSSGDFEEVPNPSKSRPQTMFPYRPDSRLGKTELSFSSCESSRVDGFHSSEELRNLGESPGDDASLEHEAKMDLGTPTYDETPLKTSKKPKTAEAGTSSELAKKSKEVFKKEMSQFIVQCLNPYWKPDCKVGRITTTEDFKHLARKLTHGIMNKELKHCKSPEDLECNDSVKHKTKEYMKKYMQKFGAVYKPK